MTDKPTRTSEEILEKMKSFGQFDDFFAVKRGDLIDFLPFDLAKEFLKPEVTEEEWSVNLKPATLEAIRTAVHDYLPFAWEKANNCRGLSASRSVDHLTAWIWMTGDEDFIKKFDEIEYQHYGKEKLIAASEYFGFHWPEHDDGVRTNTDA